MKEQRSASVLVFSLLLMSIVTIFTQQLVQSTLVGSFFKQTVVAREKAKMLALGGINLAIAQLTIQPPGQKEKNQKVENDQELEKDETTKPFVHKELLSTLLPNLNRWQTFDLKENLDGIDGTIQFCITSEEGKININEAFDFKKGDFKKEVKALLANLLIKEKLEKGILLKKMTDFFKKRNRKLNDISELIEIPELAGIEFFYKPPKLATGKDRMAPNTALAVQDLFTTWHKQSTFHPLLMSDSLCAVLGLRRPLADDAQRIKEKFQQIIESFKGDWGQDWEVDWKYVQTIYDQKPLFLKEIKGLFSKEFEPRIYSVLSCGRVDGIEQHLLAIIEKEDEQAVDTDKEKKETKKEQKKAFVIRRLYWI